MGFSCRMRSTISRFPQGSAPAGVILKDAERSARAKKLFFFITRRIWNEIVPNMIDMLLKYGVRRVYYGLSRRGKKHGERRGIYGDFV
jgi:hypothetical protein